MGGAKAGVTGGSVRAPHCGSGQRTQHARGGGQFIRRRDPHCFAILANPGGVYASYLEWAQNWGGYYWTREEVSSRLQQVMTAAFDQGWAGRRGEGRPAVRGIPARGPARGRGDAPVRVALKTRNTFPRQILLW